jgi:hypothetical protein
MTKQLSAVLAAAAFIGFSAGEHGTFPLSVNDAGPVLTAEQQRYQDQWQASRQQAQGVAGRPGFAMESIEASGQFYEVQTPSRGGPVDD